MLLQICDKLGVCKDMPLAYLREVQVWLPDIQWPGSKPHCPTCLLNSSVGPHAWQEGVKASRAQLTRKCGIVRFSRSSLRAAQ